LDYQFIIPPKDLEEKHYIPATKDSIRQHTKWIPTTVVATEKGWRYGIHAPTIEDTKTTIIKMGGVLVAKVSIRECPECIMNKYYRGEVIQGNCIFIIFLTGESVFVHTELDNTLFIQTRPTRYHHNNQMNIPTGFFESGKSTAYDILSTVIH
jgi:hypothetical protein